MQVRQVVEVARARVGDRAHHALVEALAHADRGEHVLLHHRAPCARAQTLEAVVALVGVAVGEQDHAIDAVLVEKFSQ